MPRPDTIRRFLYLLATERHPGKHRHNQKMILGFVPSAERDELKKALDIEAERIRKRASPPSSTRKKFASWMMAPCSTAGF
jgi:hypothetical protein